MKCPVLLAAFIEGPGRITSPAGDCLQEECAWWVGADKECAVKDLALHLSATHHVLDAMHAHMPKQAQFVGRP